MSKIYRTAMGTQVDMDMLRLANENTIAIGNARTNARGDLLGPGGAVVKTKAQLMQDYHKLNTLPATEDDVLESAVPEEDNIYRPMAQTAAQDMPVAETSTVPDYVKPRGSFAEAVAGETEVNQELLKPLSKRGQGIQRI